MQRAVICMASSIGERARLPRRALSLNARPVPIGARFRNCCSVMIRTRRVGNNKLAKCSRAQKCKLLTADLYTFSSFDLGRVLSWKHKVCEVGASIYQGKRKSRLDIFFNFYLWIWLKFIWSISLTNFLVNKFELLTIFQQTFSGNSWTQSDVPYFKGCKRRKKSNARRAHIKAN
jgi:hypothetical protein